MGSAQNYWKTDRFFARGGGFYVTGSHQIKFGIQNSWGPAYQNTIINGDLYAIDASPGELLCPKEPSPLPIQAVLIGPSPHKALNVESAKTLLIRNGYLNVLVDASNTSYRA